ncbi:integrase domain-containing protein [Geotalea sp. SG265]|uniref:integrase domain-containing protein n=1 Tax=Geotalea sp. SG265 TaxID=2922867 RepID=UPI001FAFBEBE|nr:integrase domain-containing protein [Geotalea sp. SG265]
MGKPLSTQALSTIGKQWGKAKLTREANLQHLKGFAHWVQNRYGLERIENLKPAMIAAYVDDLKTRGASNGAICNHLSAIRMLAAAIGKANIVPKTNGEFGVARLRMRPVIANYEKVQEIRAEVAAMAGKGDRVAMMMHAAAELREAFGLRAKESLLSRVGSMDGKLYLQVSGAKGGRPRALEVRTDQQLKAVQIADQVATALGSKSGRIMPPELTLKEAYDAQRTMWRNLGGTKENKAHMHSMRHTYAQESAKHGMSKQELMKELGHGEERSPGFYIPKN